MPHTGHVEEADGGCLYRVRVRESLRTNARIVVTWNSMPKGEETKGVLSHE